MKKPNILEVTTETPEWRKFKEAIYNPPKPILLQSWEINILTNMGISPSFWFQPYATTSIISVVKEAIEVGRRKGREEVINEFRDALNLKKDS